MKFTINIPRTDKALYMNGGTVAVLLYILYCVVRGVLYHKYMESLAIALLGISWFVVVPFFMFIGQKYYKNGCDNPDCRCNK